MTLSVLPCDDELTFAESDGIVMNSNSHDDHHDSTDLVLYFVPVYVVRMLYSNQYLIPKQLLSMLLIRF